MKDDQKEKKFEIAVRARAKHGMVYRYIKENGLTTLEAAKKIGIGASTLLKILHFKWIPTTNYQNKIITAKLCDFFKCELNDLLPREVIEQIISETEIAKTLQNEQVEFKEVDLVYLDYTELPENLLAHEEEFDKNIDFKDTVQAALETLPPKLKEVIRLKFGIEGSQEHSFREIGEIFGFTGNYARVLTEEALRKLRHPSRAKRLKVLVE